MIRLEAKDVEEARAGNRAALERIIQSAQKPVFNLSMRMLANRADAEDATQEILVKIATHLGALRETGAAGAWAFQLACRHLGQMRKRGRVEAMRFTFKGFASDLEQGCAALPADELDSPETKLAIEEVKIGCTLAMLTCLNRPQRLSYILGDVLELSDREAASALDITPATYRQRLKRARDTVHEFVLNTCGVASSRANCRCADRVIPARQSGRIQMGQSQFGLDTSSKKPHISDLSGTIKRLEEARRAAALMRTNPDFETRIAGMVMQALG